jgi:hypothetical protein
VLDNFYIPARYPNGRPEGAPFEHYGPRQSTEVIELPGRSLHMSVLRWPDQEAVHSAVAEWARKLSEGHERVSRVGYAGSYARGNWGVGSDVEASFSFERPASPSPKRARAFDATGLPVPADVLVYTEDEWRRMERDSGLNPVVWIGR